MEDPQSSRLVLSFINLTRNTHNDHIMLAVGLGCFSFLIILTALISVAETAFVSTSHASIEDLIQKTDSKKAKRVKKMLENPNRFLSTIQVLNTLFSFLNGMITSLIFLKYTINYWNIDPHPIYQALVGIAITLVVTYFQVVFAELVPKRVGMKWPEKIIVKLIDFILFFYYLFYPLIWFLTVSTTGFARLFGVKKGDEVKPITEEDIRVMARARGKIGEDQKQEFNYISNIFEFNDTTVSDVMTHRIDVAAIDKKATKAELLNTIKDLTYSRYPVYNETMDDIIGIIHVKDVIKYLIDPKLKFKISRFIRPANFVYEGMKIDEVFKKMKQNKHHMAIVVDEYGGTSGIVTLEDVIEEVLGEIDDEYDESKLEIRKLEDDKYEILGSTYLEDIESSLEITFPNDDEYDTLSGFMISIYKKVPENNETIEFDYNGFHFKSLEIEDFVIKKVILTKLKEENTDVDKKDSA